MRMREVFRPEWRVTITIYGGAAAAVLLFVAGLLGFVQQKTVNGIIVMLALAIAFVSVCRGTSKRDH
jgi:hypothetical protein